MAERGQLVKPVRQDVAQLNKGRLALRTHPNVNDGLRDHTLDAVVLGLDQGQIRLIAPELDQT